MPQLFKGKVEPSEGVVVPFHKRKHTQEEETNTGQTKTTSSHKGAKQKKQKKTTKTTTEEDQTNENNTNTNTNHEAAAAAPAAVAAKPVVEVDKSSKEYTGKDIAAHARAAMKANTTFTFGFNVAEEEEGEARGGGGGGDGQEASAAGVTASEDSRTIYVGGLPYEIQDVEIEQYFSEYGQVERIDKLTFSDSGRFNGIAFVTFDSGRSAKKALQANGQAAFSEDRYLVVRKYARPNETDAAGQRKALQHKTPIERRKGYHRVYVGNLPWSCTEDLLREFFEYHFTHWDDNGLDQPPQDPQDPQVVADPDQPTSTTPTHEQEQNQKNELEQGTPKQTERKFIKFLRMGCDKEGNFKGFAHIHFSSEEDVDKALQLNGEYIEGRQIKISPAVPPKK